MFPGTEEWVAEKILDAGTKVCCRDQSVDEVVRIRTTQTPALSRSVGESLWPKVDEVFVTRTRKSEYARRWGRRAPVVVLPFCTAWVVGSLTFEGNPILEPGIR